MIAALASVGVFVAVPVTGRLALGNVQAAAHAVARPSLWVAAGIAIWSVPLLGSLALGIYRPEVLGLAGWAVVAIVAALRVVRGRGWTSQRSPRWSKLDAAALMGIVLGAVLIAAFPADPFTGFIDFGIYSNHAVYIANHGRLDIPYPWPAGEPMPQGLLENGQLFLTQPTMTVRFSNLWPAWLAQTYAATGYEGMVRVNAVVSALSLLAVYSIARRFVDARIAAFAVVFLAFNPSQVWVARQTLSEIPTQFLIWSGLLVLTGYFSRPRPAWGVWAGVLLGLAAFVRVDALLLVPLLLLSHALSKVMRSRQRRRPKVRWSHVYVGLLPLSVSALAYYAIFNRPYLDDIATQLLMLGGLTAIAIIGLTITFSPAVLRLAHSLIARRRVIIGVLAILVVITVYAYFIRPIAPPFARVDVPGAPFGGRTFAEDALPNLGRYLTPGVFWAAVLGWSALFAAVARKSAGIVALVPLLIVALGYTAVYAWSQSVTPTHFEAIRRFVPVIIPAIIIFAASGVALALKPLSGPGRRLALGLSAPLLILFTLWIGFPMYVVKERQGGYDALVNIAAAMPADWQFLAIDGHYEWWRFLRPLHLAFDRPIIALDPETDEGRAEAMRRLQNATANDPVMLVTAAYDGRMDAVVGVRRLTAEWSAPVMAMTVAPVPRTIVSEHNSITLIEATGLNTIGVRFGGPPQWVARAIGFHPWQLVDGRMLRWTNGAGRLSIPILGDAQPDTMSISIADTGPGGGPLRIVLNGKTLFDGFVPAGPWSADYELDGLVDLRIGETAEVEIVSDVFDSAPVDQLDYETSFGVQVDSVKLLVTDH